MATVHRSAGIVALALAVTLVGCSAGSGEGATPTEQPLIEGNTALEELVDAARQDGALTATWAVYSQATTTALIEAFKREFDLDIPVQIRFQSDIPAITAKLIEEAEAGIEASSDFILSNADYAIRLGSPNRGLISSQDWESVAPWVEGMVAQDGEFVLVGHDFPGFIYNTDAFSEGDVPTTAEDVIGLAQTVASTPYAVGFGSLGKSMGQEGVFEYVSEFAPAGFITCGEVNRIASGEFDAMWIGCGRSYVEAGLEDGAPLGFTTFPGATIVNAFYLGVPKNSAHPNAAKLFAAWMNTPEAQAITEREAHIGNAALPGTPAADYLTSLEADGYEPLVLDVQFVLDNPGLYEPAYIQRIVQLLTQN